MKTLEAVRCGTIALLLCVQTSAVAVTFTHDSFISFGDPSYDGQDIVVTNCTLTVDGPHVFNSVRLVNGGVLTHSPFPYGPQLFLDSASNEPHELNATNGTPLNNTNVDASSIVVMNFSGFTVYTENVDYLVTFSNGATLLTLTTNSAIAPGLEVMVSYDWIDSLQGFNLTVSNNLQVDASSSIDVSGKGYSGGLGFQNGTGASSSTNFPFTFTAGGGGAHGGAGGMSSTFARGGAAYDSITNPATLGSGGGLGSQPGGAGGGVALLTVGGNLQLDGQILANGFKGTNAHSGGGAGGSILISAQSLSGAGTIAANGGGGDLPDGGGGGGGRIAVNYGTNNFVGNTTAFGDNGANAGGAGTVYMQAMGSTAGQLFIVNGGKRGTNTPFSPLMVNNLTVSGGAVAQSLSPNFAVTNLFIGSNSWLTVTDAFEFILTVSNNATIESNGMINVDAKSISGPGTGIFTGCAAGGGGSYGGYGGSSVCGSSSGQLYGSVVQPTSFGSPGTFSGNGGRQPARGGGAIQLTVGGTLSLAGNISADGEPATIAGTGAGSGGSVWLTVGTLLGGGTISANGGSASNAVSGAGGGGRVAVYYNSNALSGSIQAYGGSGTNNGGAGTVYLKKNSALDSKLIIDNGGLVGLTALPPGAGLGIPFLNLQISGNAVFTNSNPALLSLQNLFIGSNSWMVGNPGTTANIQIGTNATIQPGGGITVDGQSSSTTGTGLLLGTGGGGGNGGNGGAGSSAGTNFPGGSQIGSITEPSTPGAIGGPGVSGGASGKGGGVILLSVGNTLQLDGALSANGTTGPGFYSGGGAGGSIQITTTRFSGAGIISANGGAANNNGPGGGGGGGRIAVNYITNSFTGNIVAYGGAGANYGGAGTIFTGRSPGGLITFSQITIDNGGMPGAATSLFGQYGSTINLTITGGAYASNALSGSLSFANLLVGSNSVFQVSSAGSLQTISVTSNITVQAGGSINADGLSTSIVNNFNGQTLNSTGGGGGSAGTGGNSAFGALGGGASTGSIPTPLEPGGRGGAGIFLSGNVNNGGNGGGSLKVSAGQTLRVDGRISTDGVTSPSINSGGGGGGSLTLACRTLSGGGMISANGGAGNAAGGGGGGGRISIELTTNAFTGTLTAHGGGGANYGGAGFIYAASNPQFGPLPVGPPFLRLGVPPLLVLDNGGVQGGFTPLLINVPDSVNLTITGGAFLTNNAGFSVQSLLIGSNSTWLLGSPSSLVITVLSNITIQSSGRLTVDGTSISANGLGQTFASTGGGGGHGGYGGSSLSNALGGVVTSDSLSSPQGTGGRGGFGSQIALGSVAANGGGALQLTVRGALQLDGRISADGISTTSLNGGGGAGGSVWLQIGKLSGAGSISANGGPANTIGGGGGGGRVAIWANTNTFIGAVTARGGAGGNYGGAGTIYTVPSMNNQARGLLTVDNGGVHGTNTPITGITSAPGAPDLLIGSGAFVTFPTPSSLWNSLTISSNSVLSIDPSISVLALTISSNLTIQLGGTINLDAHGFPANQGSGSGLRIIPGAPPFTGGPGGGGAGHGGNGSEGNPANGAGASYDSILGPTQPGSGGAALANPPTGSSAGGGALHLTVNGILTVNGSISANGSAGRASGAGGGSGGSIWVTTAGIFGTGNISANGGDGEFFGGGGGGAGGRIAVFFNSNRFTGPFSAVGGEGAQLAGGAGTVYLKTNFTAVPRLILDNGGEPGADTPLSQIPLVDLFITNGAAASTTSSQTFQDLFIGQGGVFNSDGTSFLTLNVNGNAAIDSGGAINADLHLPASAGSGDGSVDVYGDGSGGGYGGPGGASMFGAPGGIFYGSITEPTALGSAGGSLPQLAGYSQGGGALRMSVAGTLTVNGTISADGSDGVIDGSGGGSGGSIWINAKSFFGTGLVTANGGMGESLEGGGGGGGRIAIYITTNLFAGTALATGGAGASSGAFGSVYIATNLVVSGIVTDTNGVPVVGMTVQSSSLLFGVTDFNGFYFVNVPISWSGTVGPTANSFSTPATRSYSNLTTNAPNQDFVVVPITTTTFNLAGGQFDGHNLNFNYYGINGVTYTLLCSTNLVDWVPYCAPVQGSNAVNAVSVPMLINNPQQLFFRLSASY